MSQDEQLERLLIAAEQHGTDSEPDHEVGDLQDLLRVAASLMTNEQWQQFMASDAVLSTMEWAT